MVQRRILENQEPLRKVADDYGVSYETVRRTVIVAHALLHVETVKTGRTASPAQTNTALPATPLVLSSDLVDALRVALAQVTVTEEEQVSALTVLQGEQANISGEVNEQETNTYERVKTYLVRSPEASVREIADKLVMSPSTAHKWQNRVKGMRVASQ